MKLIRFKHKDNEFEGILDGDRIVPREDSEHIFVEKHLSEVKILSPVTPSKIVLVGLNYKDHAAELDMEIPQTPIIFLKPPTSVIGQGDEILYPRIASRVDYEAELAVVIKNRIKNISSEDVYDNVLGYTCFNDVTARDIQKKDGQWTRAKAFDTFSPIGPWIETDIVPDDLFIRSYVNGQLKQDSKTSELIFNIPFLIKFISQVMTLNPGDIVATGTPPNVGPLNPGDEVMVEIEGIGKLENKVVGEK